MHIVFPESRQWSFELEPSHDPDQEVVSFYTWEAKGRQRHAMNTTLARTSLETMVSETSKLTDASMKLAEQTLAPITARVTLAVEKLGRA